MKKRRSGSSARTGYGRYWRLYDTDLRGSDYAKVENALKPESSAQVSGYRTQKGLIQLRFRDLGRDVMVQISPEGKVMIYFSRPMEIEGIEDRVWKFIEGVCGRRIWHTWIKSDPIQEQHYYDMHVQWLVDWERGK